jgi:hypothetical protein
LSPGANVAVGGHCADEAHGQPSILRAPAQANRAEH